VKGSLRFLTAGKWWKWWNSDYSAPLYCFSPGGITIWKQEGSMSTLCFVF